MNIKTKAKILGFAALLILGCEPGHSEKIAGNTGSGTDEGTPVEEPTLPTDPALEPVVLDYATVNAEVITPECLSCHKAGGRLLSLETYADVMLVLNSVEREVSRGAMPPRSILSDDDKKLLLDWIAAGAPETTELALETEELVEP